MVPFLFGQYKIFFPYDKGRKHAYSSRYNLISTTTSLKFKYMKKNLFPSGWYYMADSKTIKKGKIKPFKYFDMDLALGRTSTGKIQLFKAHCPHLGAHIGLGGKFDGEQVVCPFHGWKHTLDKMCDKGLKISSLPVQENWGKIFMWYSNDHRAPDYDVVPLNQLSKGHFTLQTNTLIVKAPLIEIAENMPDLEHYLNIHNMKETLLSKINIKENTFEFNFKIDTAATLTKDLKSECQNTFYGPGLLWINITHTFNMKSLIFCTPIDEKTSFLKQQTIIPLKFNPFKFLTLYLPLCFFYKREIKKDVRIWENKIQGGSNYQLLQDSSIYKLRKWFEDKISNHKAF
jgi:phenylpropionate dioxygenase-like ring-hydroxylating dioxygenase large terminal subunit